MSVSPAASAGFRQGDLVAADVSLFRELGVATHPDYDGFVVLVSQTCDLARERPATVIVAPVVQLTSNAALAAKGVMPGFVALTALKPDAFAALDTLATVPKASLEGRGSVPGIRSADPEQERSFARAVGRKFSRFAFPDDVVEWLRPLERMIEAKALRPRSPLGRFLADVAQIRVQTENWAEDELDVAVHFIFSPGVVPEMSDNFVPEPRVFSATLETVLSTLYGSQPVAGEARATWLSRAVDLLVEKAAADALKSGAKPSAVRTLNAQLWSEDEFPLSIVRRSEQLDIDFLSPAIVL